MSPSVNTMQDVYGQREGLYASEFRLDTAFPAPLWSALQTAHGKDAVFRSMEQAEACVAMYQRRSPLLLVLGCAAGKTDIVLINCLTPNSATTIIVEPYLSTCWDVKSRAEILGIKPLLWDNSMSVSTAVRSKLIIATPEASCTASFLNMLAHLSQHRLLDRIVIDEIHQPVVDAGFRNVEAIDKLTNYSAQVVLMTATLPPTMVSSLCSFIKLPSFFTIRSTTNRMNICYQVKIVQNITKELAAILKEEEKSNKSRIMVYCRSISETRLLQSEVNAQIFHSRMTRDEQDKSLADWTYIMACTTSLSAGRDTPYVDLVIHKGPPFTMVDYIQQSGRAGRNNTKARSIILSRHLPDKHIDHLRSQKWKRSDYEALKYLINKEECRRRSISTLMDGKTIECRILGAELCDVCQKNSGRTAPTRMEEPISRQDVVGERSAVELTIMAKIKKLYGSENCLWCLVLLDLEYHHHHVPCPIPHNDATMSEWVKSVKIPKSVCAVCSLPKFACISSPNQPCRHGDVPLKLAYIMYQDGEVRDRVFAELEIEDLGLNTLGRFADWLSVEDFQYNKVICNLWKLMFGLQALSYLGVS